MRKKTEEMVEKSYEIMRYEIDDMGESSIYFCQSCRWPDEIIMMLIRCTLGSITEDIKDVDSKYVRRLERCPDKKWQ